MVGKLIVGFAHQEENIRGLHAHAERLSDHGDFFPYARTEILSGEEARALQPDLSRDITLALHSLDSGIVDSHSLMQSFEKEIKDSDETHIAYRTEAVRVDPQTGGWVVQTASRGTGTEETTSLLARTLINASGLSCNLVLNSLFKNRSDRISLAFAKGSYAGYRGPGVSQVSKLIYPVPTAERGSHSHQSLGTHLTLDIAGNIRFGPDLEWLMPDSSNEDDQADFGNHICGQTSSGTGSPPSTLRRRNIYLELFLTASEQIILVFAQSYRCPRRNSRISLFSGLTPIPSFNQGITAGHQ